MLHALYKQSIIFITVILSQLTGFVMDQLETDVQNTENCKDMMTIVSKTDQQQAV